MSSRSSAPRRERRVERKALHASSSRPLVSEPWLERAAAGQQAARAVRRRTGMRACGCAPFQRRGGAPSSCACARSRPHGPPWFTGGGQCTNCRRPRCEARPSEVRTPRVRGLLKGLSRRHRELAGCTEGGQPRARNGLLWPWVLARARCRAKKVATGWCLREINANKTQRGYCWGFESLETSLKRAENQLRKLRIVVALLEGEFPSENVHLVGVPVLLALRVSQSEPQEIPRAHELVVGI